jgi:hypothetical protein
VVINGVRRTTLILITVLALAAVTGLNMAGPAQAQTPSQRPAQVIRPAAGPGQSRSAVKAKECFYVFPNCASSDPHVSLVSYSIGDTTGCKFKDTIKWGDKTSETKTFDGGPNGAVLATFKHEYAAGVPTTYTGLATSETVTGSCGTFAPTTFQFTLTGCSNVYGPAAGRAQAQATRVIETANWAGYVAGSLTGCFTGVTGKWIQPAVTCPKTDEGTREADFWVGLDGDAALDPTVEQTGIEAKCLWDAATGRYTTTYRAWYEMAPSGPVYDKNNFEKLDPAPGSAVEATVLYNDKDKKTPYYLALTVTTKGQKHEAETTQACPSGSTCQNMSAEWIAEKVKAFSLASFAPWDLTSGFATTTSSPADHAVASFNPTAQELVPDKKVLAYVCDLSEARFTVRQSPC